VEYGQCVYQAGELLKEHYVVFAPKWNL